MLTCPICNVQFKKIDSQHLMKRHGLTREQYLQAYPNGPIGASAETRQKVGSAVKLRGPRSEETREKISKNLKGKSVGRVAGTYVTSEETKAKQSLSRKKFYEEVGVSQEWAANISAALKKRYQERPKEKMDRESDAYHRRVQIVNELASRKKQRAHDNLKSELDKLTWAEVIDVSPGERVTVKCLTCNNDINRQIQTYRKHGFMQTICHTCHPPLKGTSKAEEDINSFLQERGIFAQRHVKGLLPNNWELDFYIPELKIAIEFNGLYWHSTAMDYPKDKHRKKYEACRDNGIRLVQIFEDEWSFKQDIVKDRLLSILNKEGATIYARKCEVKETLFSDVFSFLEENHLQGGKVKTKHNYALYYEGQVVAAMTFQQKRKAMNQKKEDGALELIRFASKGRIPGAFSKLLKYAIKSLGVKKIYSWADLRWTDPAKNVYLSNGFRVHLESSVGYCYTNLMERFHRYGRRKPAGETLSEEAWNEQQGYYQLYDAGTINYVFEVE